MISLMSLIVVKTFLYASIGKSLRVVITLSMIKTSFCGFLGVIHYLCNEQLFKTKFSPQKQRVINYTRYVFEISKLTFFF